MPPEGTKRMHFTLPEDLYEAFYRAFPGYGERSQFLQKAVGIGVKIRKRLVPTEKLLEGELEDEYGET